MKDALYQLSYNGLRSPKQQCTKILVDGGGFEPP